MAKTISGLPDKKSEAFQCADALRESLANSVIIVDAKYRISFCAPEAARSLSLEKMPAPNAGLEGLPVRLQEAIRESSNSSATIELGPSELSPSLNGANARAFRVSVRPLMAGQKNSGAMVLVTNLIAARKVEQKMRQLDRLANAGTLAASMAHEIKNALVAGKTFFDLLFEKNKDAELVEVARRELNRIDVMVSRMLKFSGPGKGSFGPVHLHEVIDHSLRLVQPRMESKLITLERQFQAANDLVTGDDYQLQQAFVNLLFNALEAMGASGSLTVTTETRTTNGTAGAEPAMNGPRVCVSIRDTGIGIPPSDMAHLFEPFFTTKDSGTGLGLPITQHILQDHGGEIIVESQPGEGTTFSVVLPAA
jgi:signal transduction histidine kinase